MFANKTTDRVYTNTIRKDHYYKVLFIAIDQLFL